TTCSPPCRTTDPFPHRETARAPFPGATIPADIFEDGNAQPRARRRARFAAPRRYPTRGALEMIDITRRVSVPAAWLWLAALLRAGCNQIFGINETTLSERRAYGCECTCSGGGQTFNVDSNVCIPEALNPALNPSLPADFEPPAADLQSDCHTRVERNLEQ